MNFQRIVLIVAVILFGVSSVIQQFTISGYKRMAKEWEQASARAVAAATKSQALAEEWKGEAMHCVDMWERHQEHR